MKEPLPNDSASDKDALKRITNNADQRVTHIYSNKIETNVSNNHSTINKKLLNILTTLPIGVVVINKNQRVIFANIEAQHTLYINEQKEYLPDDKGLIYLNISGQRIKKEATLFYTIFENKVAIHNQELAIVDHKRMRWLLVNGSPVYNLDGGLDEVTINFIDITAIKASENQIFENEFLLNQYQKIANIGGWELDVSNFTAKWTKQMHLLHELPLDWTFDFKKALSFFHPEDRVLLEHSIMQAINKKKSFDIDARFQTKKGKALWVRVIGEVVINNDKVVKIRGTYTDVTSIKQASDDLIRAKEAAEKANQSKSLFLANISHEIRTPLNAVIGFTEILNSKVEDAVHKSYLKSITSSSTTLLKLINNLLDFSKIDVGELKVKKAPTDIKLIAEEVYQTFIGNATSKNIGFSYHIADTVPNTIMSDELRIKQILLNLVGNAVKFTDEGAVEVKIKCEKLPKGLINLNIVVEDTGIGISTEAQNLIFDAFKQQNEQDSKKYGGTGLGLAITKRLVELLGGYISLKSERNKGSRFDVFFPKIKVAPRYAKKHFLAPKKEDYEIFNNLTILIADDTKINRDLVISSFNEFKILFYEAENGLEAIEMARLYQPDIVLMDLIMPEMDGLSSLLELRKNPATAKIPVIAMTASISKNSELKQFDDKMYKPISIRELHRIVKKQLETRVKPKETLSLQFDLSTLSAEKKDNIVVLIKELQAIYLAAKNTGDFDETIKLSECIVFLGKQLKSPQLCDVGSLLFKQVKSFDVNEIECNMERINKILHVLLKQFRV